ncbi:XdhC family protein [Clostridium sp. CX1]|uniref:XdhC family protein n=1 Tax=Clostridium sp. CX1 TaxID=2978346 RepID=UPI0021C0AAD9|nr:XdhC/CoxI family protein [Clostridium sp. CX1]MCT8976659.1 XdhC family protein [Clostridium sp. CX1]
METNVYKDLLEKINSGKRAVMVTILDSSNYNVGSSQNKMLFTQESLLEYKKAYNFDETIYEKASYALETGTLQLETSEEKTYLIEPYFPEPNLIVLGGGHIAKPLAEFGARAGFSVTVIDDRPSFANKHRFPHAEKVICESFEKCFDLINLNESSFVVIVTRGHRHDMDCLRQVLKYDTSYVGMIGSKRRVKGVMEQLQREDYSKEKLSKVNAPIGLEIGAVTPEEIAFSIISQVIQYRRLVDRRTGVMKSSKTNWPEFDRDVLTRLSKEENAPKTVITIVSTKGSVPRKEGAKMLITSQGEILGSIGGGCSEGSVINTARYMLRDTISYQTEEIDMTGYIAEEEGMVCGGIMNVIIERFDF